MSKAYRIMAKVAKRALTSYNTLNRRLGTNLVANLAALMTSVNALRATLRTERRSAHALVGKAARRGSRWATGAHRHGLSVRSVRDTLRSEARIIMAYREGVVSGSLARWAYSTLNGTGRGVAA